MNTIPNIIEIFLKKSHVKIKMLKNQHHSMSDPLINILDF